MTASDLRTLYDYHYWATGRHLEVVGRLAPEAFTRTVAGAYGSVRNTLVHVLSVERGWVARCGGPERGPRLDPSDYPDPETLTRAWTEAESQTRVFLDQLGDDDLGRVVTYAGAGGAERSMPVGDLLLHAATHGVHHRGQVAVLLRELGHAPGDVDVLYFAAERRGVEAW